MSNKITLKKSSVGGKVPTTSDLDYGELAINYTDGKLYYKTSSNTIDSFIAGTWVKKTTTYSASTSDKIIADTSGGSWTLTLPATPATGDSVTVADGANWKTFNLTVARNGSTIEGLTEDLILDIPGIRVEFVYDGTTWEVYTFASPAASINNDTVTNTTQYPLMARATSGALDSSYVSDVGLSFNPSTGTLSSTNFNSLSDVRYKENVSDIGSALETLNRVRPVSFTWKETGNKAYGVIAQELETVLPELVELAGERKTVNYDQLIAFLIAAVQELKTEINYLRDFVHGDSK